MAKEHLFEVHHAGKIEPYTLPGKTKTEAVAVLRRELANKGITPDKIMYGGVATGSVKATDLNIWALQNLLAGGKDARPGATKISFPNQLTAVDKPHIQRCVQAGLATVAGNQIVLTEAGIKLLGIRP
jgi:hypothetical protein